MALKRKYQGREQSKSRDEYLNKETWYGSESEIDDYIATLVIGSYVQGKGYVHEWQKKQDNPSVWTVEVTYRITYSTEDNEEESDSSDSSTPKQYTLSVRNIQKPLEAHSKYKTHWNHYLICKGTQAVPDWWATATTPIITGATDRTKYRWISSITELEGLWNEGWRILKNITKPGVHVYDYACFVVQEKTRYKTSSRAGNAISKNINEINTPPHTFGISGGQWKLDEGSVEHDGKRWIATRTWTHADVWDADLYGSN